MLGIDHEQRQRQRQELYAALKAGTVDPKFIQRPESQPLYEYVVVAEDTAGPRTDDAGRNIGVMIHQRREFWRRWRGSPGPFELVRTDRWDD